MIELSGTDTATCGKVSVSSAVSPIGKLARKLAGMGIEGAVIFSVYRNGTKCFNDAPLSYWSSVTTAENDRVSVKHVPFMPFPELTEAHQMAKTMIKLP